MSDSEDTQSDQQLAVDSDSAKVSSNKQQTEIAALRKQLETATRHIQQKDIYLAAVVADVVLLRRQADTALHERDTIVAEAAHVAIAATQRVDQITRELQHTQKLLAHTAKENSDARSASESEDGHDNKSRNSENF